MKKILTVAILFALGGCSTAQRRPDPKDRWINITNQQNKVVAEVNASSGETIYLADPKDAFETLFAAFAQYQQVCKPVEKKEEPKKDEKKK